jgi:hypothetical protein
MKEPLLPDSPPREILRTTRILVFALIAGVLVFAGIITALVSVGGSILKESDHQLMRILGYAAAVSALACSVGAFALYARKISGIRNSNDALQGKLNAYRSAIILFMGLCEFAALLSVIIFFLTGNYQVLAITGLMVILMFSKLPSRRSVVNQLQLDWQEQQELV